MKLAWLTDIHLNFIDLISRQNFYQTIVKAECDGVVISGDIAEASDINELLLELSNFVENPIYFILGNHDYYRGQVNEVRNRMTNLTESNEYLFWLPASGPIKLENNIFLVGQDGWADGRYGDYLNSEVVLNDSRMIADLFQTKVLGRFQLLEKMQQFADEDAKRLQDNLEQVISQKPNKIIVLTHVPPFKEACMHQGKISDDDWLPYFSSKVMGDMLMQIAQKNLSIEFLVLCGHTHSEAVYKPINNMVVKTGKAEYMYPEVQEIILV